MNIYAANWVLPISNPSIERGAVAFEADKIAAIGSLADLTRQFPEAKVEDFEEAAILPGFVNAHAHLELTAMRGFLDDVEHDFFAWLRKLTVARGERMFAEDVKISSVCGAMEAARAGVTCLGDIATNAATSISALQTVGLRGTSFQETLSPDKKVAKTRFAQLREQIAVCREIESGTVKAGISPHAPYSVSPPLFELVTDFALAENLPVSIHAAESKGEDIFVRTGKGFFENFYAERGFEWRITGKSPIQYLHSLGALRVAPLLAHCVRVDDADLEIIHATNSKIAHCPKSNAKFGHGIAPLDKFLEKNLCVGLGSDSVASNNVCDILEEARFAALFQRTRNCFINAEKILKIATLGGAEALGLDDKIGSLEAGKQADLVVISLNSLPQMPVFDPSAALVFASTARDIVLTMVAGRVIFQNGRIALTDEIEWREKLKEVAAKIRI